MPNKHHVNIVKNKLELRSLRRIQAGRHAVVESPLNAEEAMVFDIISKHIMRKSGLHGNTLPPDITAHGKRMLLDMYVEPQLVNGIPSPWFLTIAALALIAYITLKSVILLLILVPVAHLACYLYYQQTRHARRQASITKILTEGIK